jgi:hypothetical protein
MASSASLHWQVSPDAGRAPVLTIGVKSCTCESVASADGKPAHIAHGAVLGLHALCCGAPALALIAAAASGATSSVAAFANFLGGFHEFMHAHETWILVFSVALVVGGGVLEARARRVHKGQGFPWLFAFSLACLVVNLALLTFHRFA